MDPVPGSGHGAAGWDGAPGSILSSGPPRPDLKRGEEV